ncbi:hypothetical protein [Tenacibaculum agarivorans]|uniref:hypothetical protein n=1 Tax=Tenacibaculum agarivorans TaxID=1908389 RepID=UPI00094BB9B3|nr:hypothetical protein [Tenacibaculum agarivorans]
MSIYISKDAADASLLQESTFYSDNLPPLKSKLFESNQTLQLINLGQATTLSIDRDNNAFVVELIRKSLKIIIPELINVSASKKALALSLPIEGSFDGDVEVLVKYFQQKTIALSANIDGKVGRKTLHELDKALNRIFDYDEETARTIFNHGESTIVEEVTVVIHNSSNNEEDYIILYDEPTNTATGIFRLQENDVVYVMKEGGETSEDWYYVKVLSGSKEKQIDSGKEIYDNIFRKGYELNGYIQGFNLHKSWNTYPSKMPDIYSQLHRLKDDVTDNIDDSEYLLNLIKKTYFDAVTIKSVNEKGVFDDNESIKFPAIEFPNSVNHENILLLKFILNVLIYSNNQESNLDTSITDNERSIYLKSPAQWLTIEDINNARYSTESYFSTDHTNDANYYDKFITELIAASTGYDYTEGLSGGGIKLRIGLNKGFLMWLPSRQFMVTMWNTYKYLMPVNNINTDDVLIEYAKKSVKKIFPFRSLGLRQRIELGATFLLPIGIDFVGDVSIWREDTNSFNDYTLKISAYGEIRGGTDTGGGYDFGFWNGKRGSKQKEAGIGVSAGADLQAGEKMGALIEYEIPISGVDPITTNLAVAAYGAINLIGSAVFPYGGFFAFQKASKGINFNMWNYVTKLKLYKANYTDAGAGVSAKFKYGVPDKEYNWQHPETSSPEEGRKLDNKNFIAPFLMSLFSGSAISVGLGAGVEYGYGIEVSIDYPFALSNCYDPVRDVRVPSRIIVTGFGEISVHFEFFNSLSLGLIGLPIPDLFMHQGIGIKFTIDYNIAKEIGSNQTKDYVLTLSNFLKNTGKYIGFYNFSGNLDVYEGSAYESCFYFDLGRIVNTILPNDNLELGKVKQTLENEGFVNKFTSNFLELKDTLSHVQFQKRIGLALLNRKYRRRIKKQQISKRWLGSEMYQKAFKSKPRQTFFSLNPYLDFNYVVAGKDYINFIKGMITFIRVLTAYNNVINDATVSQDTQVYISNKYKDIIDPQNNIDVITEKLNAVYSDPQMVTYMDVYGGSIINNFKTLLDITVFEISERAGFYKGNDTVTENDSSMYTMMWKLAFRYFKSMYDVNMSLHAEAGGGFGFSGQVSKGLKVRIRTHIESKIIVHSDLIKDDGCFPFSFWFKVISDLIGADPLKLYENGPSNQYSPAEEIKERVPLFENGYYESVLGLNPSDENIESYDPSNNTKSNFLDVYVEPYLKILFDKQF